MGQTDFRANLQFPADFCRHLQLLGFLQFSAICCISQTAVCAIMFAETQDQQRFRKELQKLRYTLAPLVPCFGSPERGRIPQGVLPQIVVFCCNSSSKSSWDAIVRNGRKFLLHSVRCLECNGLFAKVRVKGRF